MPRWPRTALRRSESLRTEPPTPTAIPLRVQMSLDMRHTELTALELLDAQADALAAGAARDEGCEVEREAVWSIDPLAFDRDLVERATAVTDAPEPLTSGPLHDAAAVARAGVPTVMLFVRTRGGVSHSREEDARDEDVLAGVKALGTLVCELAGADL